MDIAADELGIDPVELRRRNLLQPDQFPMTSVMGAKYDTGEYEASLDEALRLADYDALRADQAERRARGENRAERISFRTRVPSLRALRCESPVIRGNSTLGISAIRRPARAAWLRIWDSISNPFAVSASRGRAERRKAR